MKTETQLKAEVYSALNAKVNTYWINKPIKATAPYAVYSLVNAESSYSFDVVRSAELPVFQIDLYCNSDDETASSNKYDEVKTAMETLKYQRVGSVEEFDSAQGKVIIVSRWERYNV
jgi:hypothetical protein